MTGADRPPCSSILIGASVDRVWCEVDRPGHLERFHPFCESNPTFAWTDGDRRDRISYFSGLVLDRTFTSWTPPHGFLLDIGTADGGPTNSVHWYFVSVATDTTRATIAIHRMPGAPASSAGRESLEDYLDSVLLGLRHVVERDEPVTRNQFGSHPMFSPAA